MEGGRALSRSIATSGRPLVASRPALQPSLHQPAQHTDRDDHGAAHGSGAWQHFGTSMGPSYEILRRADPAVCIETLPSI